MLPPRKKAQIHDRKRSSFHRLILPVIFLLAGSLSGVSAAEYYVNKAGSEAGDGRTRDTAFATIQKGADALAGGDTLIIGPGEYGENVARENLGTPEKQTVIRAEIPGTVVLRGDVPAPEFQKADGFRFVYVAHFDEEPLAVLEHDTLKVLVIDPDLNNLEFQPGLCHYDAEKKLLYISPSDLRSPDGRKYSVNVLKGQGLFLNKPRNVLIEGLVFTGYCVTPKSGWPFLTARTWGLALDEPIDCVIRRCTAFLNYAGIGLSNGSGNLMDDCLAFGNITYNLFVFGGPNNHDNTIENSYAYRAQSGMHFYGRSYGPVTLRNNRAWGHELDFSNKSGTDDATKYGSVVERCIGLGNFQAHGLKHTIMGGLNEYDRSLEAPADNILFARENDLDQNREFADPVNGDFHLQSTSRFRGKEGQPDSGLYPYKENIYYLSTAGSDQNDGLALDRAWKTLPAALKKLQPGDTLYLEKGAYEANVSLKLDQVRIMGRGVGPAIIRGSLTLERGSTVECARLLFTDPVSVKNTKDVIFRNCQFAGSNEGLLAVSVQGLTVAHCLFAQTSLGMTDCSEATLTGNFFSNEGAAALKISGGNPIAYSDYNGYQNTKLLLKTGSQTKNLKEVQAGGNDLHSLERNGQVVVKDGIPLVQTKIALEGWGPMASSLGVYNEMVQPPATLAGPFIHSTDDTTANIEWWMSAPMAVELKWGPTPEMTHTVTIPMASQYSGYSLTGLQKDQKYFVSLQPLEDSSPVGSPQTATFDTAEAVREQTDYYVAADGNDTGSGLSRDQAFRTIAMASQMAKAGSTIFIATGNYLETVRIRATGTKERPVTFQSLPGEKVSVTSFFMAGKNHVKLDGLYTSSPITALLSNDLAITRCFSLGTLIRAQTCQNVSVKNCVVANAYFSAFEINNSPEFSVENSVILRPAIMGAAINNQTDQKVRFSRNIFTDSIPFKSKIPYFAVGRAESLLDRDNCYYMRTPDKEKDILVRLMYQLYGDADYDRAVPDFGVQPAAEQPSKITTLTNMGFDDFEQTFGKTGSFFANPQFQGASEIKLEEGQRVTTKDLSEGYLVLFSDKLLGKKGLDFPDLFATNPEVVKKGIGLVPADFKDFHFNQKPRSVPTQNLP